MVSIIQYYTKSIKLQCSIALFLFPLITVNAVTAKFETRIENKCSPVIVTFRNLSTTEPGTTYYWNFGKGAISNSPEMIKQEIYTEPGTYKVTLLAVHGAEKDSVSTTIVVYKKPEALFSSDAVNGCAPFTVTLTSISIPGNLGIRDIIWDFRNGDTLKGKSVQYTYRNAGTYDILLSVTDTNGCSDVFELNNYFKVSTKPVADFSASDTFGCSPPLNVTFINKSVGTSPLTYKWDFGNGTVSNEINSSAVYNRRDSFDVKLRVTDANGCTDSLTKIDFIKVAKRDRRGMYSLVNGIEDYGGTVCPGNITFGFEVKNQPDYHYEVNYNNSTYHFYTQQFTLNVKVASVIIVKLWYGTKTLCPDSGIYQIGVDEIKAKFSIDNPYSCKIPHNVHLTNLSENALSYSWFINDKFVSNVKNPNHTFDDKLAYNQIYNHNINTNEYNIKLIAESEGHCKDSVSENVVITRPVARFMPDTVSGCIPLTVTFSDSSHSNVDIKKWVYKIGSDSIVSSSKSPVSYTFNKSGSYKTYLIVTDNNACVDTSYNINIEAGSIINSDFNISKNSLCFGDTLKLNGSPDSTGIPFKWRYSSPGVFNTGFIKSPDTSVIVKSSSNGNKTIKLEVNYSGCISEKVKNDIYSVNGPSGNFINNFSCDNPFNYTFISKIKPATTLTWTIDTHKIVDNDTAKYTFLKSGIYNVRLIAEDAASGCKITRNSKISVRDVKADFTIKRYYCLGDSTKLSSKLSNDYISKCYFEGFLWDFNDNTPPRRTYDTVFSHTYPTDTTYRPLLTVLADNGCIDTISKTTTILSPEPEFTAEDDSGCGPQMNVLFTNTSKDPTIRKWIWFFGDGNLDTSSHKQVNHLYAAKNNVFNSVLRVIDFHSCYTDISKPIVMMTPDASFQALDNALCLGQEATFQKAETNLDSYTWTFGDNSTSNSTDVHLYKNLGTYDVSLTVSKNKCKSKVTRNAYISVEKADASYSVSDSVFDCYPHSISFAQTDNGSYVQRLWNFGNRSQSDENRQSVNYIYTKPGKYITSLYARSLNGCTDRKSKLITITGPIAYFSFNPKTICYGDSVVFHIDSLKDVDRYRWYYADGETGEAKDTMHFYYSRGILTPNVIVQNKNCSTSVDDGSIYITRLQAAFDFKDRKNILCEGTLLTTINKSSYNNTSIWKLNNTVISTNRSLTNYLIDAPDSYRLKLEVGDNNNCIDTISKPLYLIKKPRFDINGKTLICRGIDTALLTISPQNNWSVNWTPLAGINNPASFTVYASPDTTTTYIAIVTDTAGCSGFDTIRLTVNQPYSLISFPKEDTTINIGEPAYLTVISDKENVSYWWSPDYKISCRTCNNPVVIPYKDYTYTVKVKDECFEKEKKINIKIIKNYYLEAPEAFSPNNDGNNDKFYFEHENIKLFNLKIFNRWGSIVFESNDIQKGWDGTFNGKKQNVDTYSYIVEAETISGYKFEKKGTVILLK